MKIFIYLLLSLCVVVSNAYANRSLRLKKVRLVKGCSCQNDQGAGVLLREWLGNVAALLWMSL